MPLDCLPDVMRDFVVAVSSAVGCDPSFVVLPLLSACSGVLGNARRIRVKRGWFVPPILWTAVVGESGTQKSPPLRAVVRFLKDHQQALIDRYHSELGAYKQDLADYRKALKQFEKDGAGEQPVEPVRPICERCLVSDSTIEGLVPILQDNWRGVLLQRDELSGWIGGFDKYSKAGSTSADAAHWLSVYNADALIVDRKTGEPKTLFVPSPAVSVCGGIQPGILNRALGAEHRENGLAARLLMSYPPRKAKAWSDDEIPEAQERAIEDLMAGLLSLQPDIGADGNSKPGIVFLDETARRTFIEFYNRTAQEQSGLSGDLAASWSKLEEIPARLALVFHCVQQVTSSNVEPWTCDGPTMKSAVTLAEWFKSETERIQTLLSETTEEREQRQLAEWIQQRGGVIRERDIVAGRRTVKDVVQAGTLLQSLVTAGFGDWRNCSATDSGGRPTREFVLS
ncbi:MAG: YfjI family protein [Planctomycetaceae bacterium]